MRFRNWLLFLFVVFLWGLNWSAMKVALGFAPPMTFVLHRLIVSTIALSPVPFVLWKKFPRDKDTLGKLLFYSLICAFQMISLQIGLVGESSGMGAVLFFTQPLFVYCFAIPFLKEKVTALNFLGTILGFLGVFILLVGRASSLILSSSLILILSAFSWAVATLYYKKFLNNVDLFVTTFFQSSISILPFAMLSLVANSIILPRETAYLLITVYSSIGAMVIGMAVWLFLLKKEEATILSGSTFIIPVVALIFGWQLLGETIYVESAFGSALVLGGLYLVNLKRYK